MGLFRHSYRDTDQVRSADLLLHSSMALSAFFSASPGINPKDIEENVTEEEIIMIVSEGHQQGVIEASEAEMISNIFKFDDKEVL